MKEREHEGMRDEGNISRLEGEEKNKQEHSITSINKGIDKIKRGLTSIIEEQDFDQLLKSGKTLRIKLGIDPTASLIHLGHLVLIFKLREFQEIGHEVCLIIGDFTAQIGDPSGRTSLRPKLSEHDVKENAKEILRKVKRFLIEERTRVYFNSEWFKSIGATKLFELFSKGTVAQIIAREDFKKRMHEKSPIFVHEFLYPFLQAYDSVVVRADIELGGSDQLFNLLFAREIMKEYGLPPEVCITTPILEGTDGKLKMSKSYHNYITPDEPAEDIYGKLMGVDDELIFKYAELLCGYENDELDELKKIHRFEAKTQIAFKITARLKGEKEALRAKEWFNKVIREKEIPEEIPQIYAKEGEILQKVLKEAGVVSSVSEATRLTESGGIYINGEKVKEKFFELKKGEYKIRVGKTKFLKLIVK
jgi:tyrosyl-tRNA synthetase